jgi:hypothetical protein
MPQRKKDRMLGRLKFSLKLREDDELPLHEGVSVIASELIYRILQDLTAPILPPETLPFMHTLNYIETEVLAVRTNKLDPKSFARSFAGLMR